jgi:hypothetical protein
MKGWICQGPSPGDTCAPATCSEEEEEEAMDAGGSTTQVCSTWGDWPGPLRHTLLVARRSGAKGQRPLQSPAPPRSSSHRRGVAVPDAPPTPAPPRPRLLGPCASGRRETRRPPPGALDAMKQLCLCAAASFAVGPRWGARVLPPSPSRPAPPGSRGLHPTPTPGRGQNRGAACGDRREVWEHTRVRLGRPF